MTRVPFPDDVNPDPGARYYRTLLQAFPCDAQQAQAVFKEVDVCRYGALWWACMCILAIAAAIVIVVTA
jgi:hypothetical protein